MLAVDAALAEVLACTARLAPRKIPAADSLGSVLAEDVRADRDLPPFPKAMMDGVAVRSADAQSPNATLEVIEEITAGHLPLKALGANTAARIMTGAALPDGADAVVMVEQCRFDATRVTLAAAVHKGQHVQPVGREMHCGDVVASAGSVVRPHTLAILATVGQTSVNVFATPRVAILTTGDEIVEPHVVPGPGQIRNSNGPMLVGQCVKAGATPIYLGIAGDDRARLEKDISVGANCDVLVLSGGVSMGSKDLVPDVLAAMGMSAHFHKVAMKPGKPLLFGTLGDTLIFGLPGNPVSSFVGFELFVRPALRTMRGMPEPLPKPLRLPLAEAFLHKSDRPTYHPACLEPAAIGEVVRALPWHGSPDLKGLASANALAILPAGEHPYAAGDIVDVLRLPE